MSYFNLVSRYFKAPKIFLLLIALSLTLLFQLAFYYRRELGLSFQSTYNLYTLPDRKLIFPKSLQVEDLDRFVRLHPGVINSTTIEWNRILLAKHTDQLAYQKDVTYVDHNLTLYHSSKNIADFSKYKQKLQERITIGISGIKDLGVPMTSVLRSFILEAPNNAYYQEILPYFAEHLKELFMHDTIDNHWYRLAGSSVWLEDYGVHFMISRILYSPNGARNQPILSLTYAQIFDENWNELKDTTLVVPSNFAEDTKEILKESTSYKMLKFPFFLPIPFWHDYDNVDGKYYGAEDPRIVLIKNKLGFEEPLIILNSYNRRLERYDDDEEGIVTKPTFFRSMYVCWPWKYQYGKEITDGEPSEEFDNKLYNKVVRLSVPELSSVTAQKNWTPLFSEIDRAKNGYDVSLNFVYRWKNLEVLKCDLLEKEGECSFIYRMDDTLPYNERVGPLRGGTDLVNLNSLIKSNSDIDINEIIPEGREISIGFARAHLKDCGCGASFYRPNMAVIVKDRVKSVNNKENDQEELVRYMYKVSYLSSFISFNVPISGWNMEYPLEVCNGNNVLLPNGISSMTIKSIEKNPKTGRWSSEDYTTLTLSMNDFTVYALHIKGLIDRLLNTHDRSLFYPSSENDLLIPTDNDSDLIGYNNDNIKCALEGSEEFCKIYGILNQVMYAEDALDGLDDSILG